MELLVNIDVPDLDKAIHFYETGLGLTLARRLFGGSVAEMRGAAVPLYLLCKEAGTPATGEAGNTRHYARHWTPVHLDFVVPDVQAAVARALAAGATLEQAPRQFAWGDLAVMSDPFGHGLCFVQWRNGGYEEVQHD